jgi:Zn-finger nucleic acid-binding protein
MKQCPKCHEELKSTTLAAVEVDECQSCKGIWFDKGELKEAKDATDSDLNWMNFEIWKHEDQFKATASAQSCPICNKPMVSIAYGETGVSVDFCEDCKGAWLQKDEFKNIIDALEDELTSKTFSEYVKDAIKEGVEIVRGSESLASEWKDFSTVLRLMQYRLLVENQTLQKAIASVQKSAQ